ncbi:hypothetical protein TRFO_39004 [Tritrichomonas foetus]|uniref:Raptor N-terminal CASPase-like domain-containing protein n=1 Tax=Tritrichomonas foetus TaxID=1144522 RepID=A0A1J4J992_9EUKA|nr:hypothetical protein TRFO_39004 [Tritrichomonas foetus]|eukprot:OHS94815.1 hypothetical protein TRFO_39004 [Tritrichomonas foetus]
MLPIPTVNRPLQKRRNPLPTNRTQVGPAQPRITQPPRTKCAFCFLCLFDGLRTPSIRRLIRKPRTVCRKPLLTFDPSFYAPSSTEALQDLYRNSLNCPCSISVDPPVQTVINLLEPKEAVNINQRVLIHYFGQGCHAPTTDGSLYFFSEDRSRYKPMKIFNIINKCRSPICFIFDCSSAAALKSQLKSQKDIFAFFACDTDEGLPLSTDAPMDLFSSCLISSYDTAIWWHMQRHSTVYDQPRLPNEENKEFLTGFLNALLDAIAFESQSLSVYKAYTEDPTMAALFRGFVLAQRVMLSFNIHSTALPDLQQMSYHSFWDVWDIAIDCCITLATDAAILMLFNLCIETFETFSSPGIFPIYGYFIQTPSISEKAALELLKFLENNPNMIDSAASSNLPNVLINLSHPTATTYLILAKLLTSNHASNFDLNLGVQFSFSKDIEVIKAGILTFCCALIRCYSPNYSRVSQICFEHAVDAAPMAPLLIGLLSERGNKPAAIPGMNVKIAGLLKDPREDIRASVVFYLGSLSDRNTIQLLYGLENDPSSLVRQQVVFSLTKLMKIAKDQKSMEMINILSNDPCESVRNSVNQARMSITKPSPKDLSESSNPIFGYLLKSVHTSGFSNERYQSNIFDYFGRPQ